MSRRKSSSNFTCGEAVVLIFLSPLLCFPIGAVILVVVIVLFFIFYHIGSDNSQSSPSQYVIHDSTPDYSGVEIITTVRDSSGKIIRKTHPSTGHPSNYFSSSCYAVRKKWANVLDRHWELCREISKSYSATLALNRKKEVYFTSAMDAVIELCQHDIALAEQYKSFLSELSCAEMSDHVPLSKRLSGRMEYSSFRQLAIIYEKRGDFESAIAVCDEAISLGFIDESAGKTTYERRDRLYRRAGISPPVPDVSDFDPFSAAE